MKLRLAVAADLAELIRIELSGEVHWGEEGLKQALEDSNVLFLTAVDKNSAIAGYIAALIIADEMQVQNIVVDPDFRRRGIGELLLREATKHAHSRGAREIFLEVSVNNSAAVALYEKLGFQRAGTRPDFYRDGTDGIIMQNKTYYVEK